MWMKIFYIDRKWHFVDLAKMGQFPLQGKPTRLFRLTVSELQTGHSFKCCYFQKTFINIFEFCSPMINFQLYCLIKMFSLEVSELWNVLYPNAVQGTLHNCSASTESQDKQWQSDYLPDVTFIMQNPFLLFKHDLARSCFQFCQISHYESHN